ncbi:hypothetical protein [Lysobacter firmicutimachus]|uniref:Uncharacterized protein n=1 Tax=Lysobacter firmicutimachus TaxID=1792846 RepID=A0ABU8D5Y0_9GAMM
MMIVKPVSLSLIVAASITNSYASSVLTAKEAAALAEAPGITSWHTEIIRASPTKEVVFVTYQPPQPVGTDSCKLMRNEFVAVGTEKGFKTIPMAQKTMLALRPCGGIDVSEFRQLHGKAHDLQPDKLVPVLRKAVPAFGGQGSNVKFGSASLRDAFNRLSKSDLARFSVRPSRELTAIFYSKETRPDLISVRVKTNSSEVFVDLSNGPDQTTTSAKKRTATN